MSLVCRGSVDPVDTGFDQTPSQGCQCIAGVDSNCTVLWTNPLPLALRVEDLERRDWLSEKQSNGTQVGVTSTV